MRHLDSVESRNVFHLRSLGDGGHRVSTLIIQVQAGFIALALTEEKLEMSFEVGHNAVSLKLDSYFFKRKSVSWCKLRMESTIESGPVQGFLVFWKFL